MIRRLLGSSLVLKLILLYIVYLIVIRSYASISEHLGEVFWWMFP